MIYTAFMAILNAATEKVRHFKVWLWIAATKEPWVSYVQPTRQKIWRAKAELSVIFGREPWWAEFWSASASMLWSLFSMLTPGSGTESVALNEISQIAPARFWELAGMIIGIAQMVSLLISCHKSRWVSAFVSSWWWGFLASSIYSGYVNIPPGMSLYIIFASINLFSMFRLARLYVR